MPFAHELGPNGVSVMPYQPSWASEAEELISELERLVPDAVSVEHIGSTSVRGMAAKPCIDLMIVVADLEASSAQPNLAAAGFRRRPEPWNNSELAEGRDWPKPVFAPPVDGSNCNVHVRVDGAPPTSVARLFRDYLVANPRQGGDLVGLQTCNRRCNSGSGRLRADQGSGVVAVDGVCEPLGG